MGPIKKIIQTLTIWLFPDDIRIICSGEKGDLMLWDPHQIIHTCSHIDLNFHGMQNV